MSDTFAISFSGKKLPALVAGIDFAKMKRGVLGVKYELSLSFVSDTQMHVINKTYRHKDATTDVLSFELEKDLPAAHGRAAQAGAGEMFISIKEATRRAPTFGMSAHVYIAYLYIHGLVHLRGHDHGSTMDRLEKKYCKQFDIKMPS